LFDLSFAARPSSWISYRGIYQVFIERQKHFQSARKILKYVSRAVKHVDAEEQGSALWATSNTVFAAAGSRSLLTDQVSAKFFSGHLSLLLFFRRPRLGALHTCVRSRKR
jgi:hypothetical protein